MISFNQAHCREEMKYHSARKSSSWLRRRAVTSWTQPMSRRGRCACSCPAQRGSMLRSSAMKTGRDRRRRLYPSPEPSRGRGLPQHLGAGRSDRQWCTPPGSGCTPGFFRSPSCSHLPSISSRSYKLAGPRPFRGRSHPRPPDAGICAAARPSLTRITNLHHFGRRETPIDALATACCFA